ncbi:MAG: hypothetical protein U1E46_07995 [Hyphomicrobiales bacterium]
MVHASGCRRNGEHHAGADQLEEAGENHAHEDGNGAGAGCLQKYPENIAHFGPAGLLPAKDEEGYMLLAFLAIAKFATLAGLLHGDAGLHGVRVSATARGCMRWMNG